MTEQDYSKTPWNLTDDGSLIVQIDDMGSSVICEINTSVLGFKENALFIVKCVNSHEKLVEALNKVKEELEFINAPSKDGWDDLLITVKQALKDLGE